MADAANEELEGNTLNVYAYIVHENRPVGTRDVTRGANLSSTSVAHRHLQKLESFGLIEKNEYGDFILKKKSSINGHMWIGRNLVPRLMFYSFFFMGAFGAEVTIIVLSHLTFGVLIENNFLFLTGITAAAMVLFLIEGMLLLNKSNPKRRRTPIQDTIEETFEMVERRHIEKIVKITCIVFTIAFVATTILYWSIALVFHSEIYYLGIVAVALLFPFLLSIVFVMVVSAKRTIDEEIEREEESKRKIAEMSAEEKKNNK